MLRYKRQQGIAKQADKGSLWPKLISFFRFDEAASHWLAENLNA